MTFLEMSLCGSIMVLAAAALRALTLRRLPKETFVALWQLTALRLLVPLELPSRFSVYTLLRALRPKAAVPAAPVLPDAPAVPAAAPPAVPQTLPPPSQPAAVPEPFPIWTVLWIAGAAALALWFLIRYIRWRRRFRESLPADCPGLETCLCSRRRVRLRVSDQIAAPLTYGILRPVILLPRTLDLRDEEAVTCVLAHEMAHIRKLDSLFKLVLAAVLCLHWFNPAVWLLYILASRDMELRCDEAAVLSLGKDGRERYALTLLRLAELRNECVPLCGFSRKSGMEERIRAIMSIKKKSARACGAALALVLGITTVFATSAKPEEAPKSAARPPVADHLPAGTSGEQEAPASVQTPSPAENIQPLAQEPPEEKPEAPKAVPQAPSGDASAVTTPETAKGTPVYAVGAGTVKETGYSEQDGWYVRIDHGWGEESFYGSCRTIEVQTGDRLAGGEVVATLDGERRPRLEFLAGGVVMDPLAYKDANGSRCLFNPFAASQGSGAGPNGDYSGKPIIAIMDGTILEAGEIEAGGAYNKGPYVEIVYASGYSMRFLACRSVLVKTGDAVKAGDVIAVTGDGAHASGPSSPADRAERAASEERERRQMEAELVNGDYPRNSRGQTYGHDYYDYLGYSPDLLSVWTVDGALGYASYVEMCGCDPVTHKAVRDSAAYRGGFVPVYDLEGNEIGSFFIEEGTSGSVPGTFASEEEAREALENGWPGNA